MSIYEYSKVLTLFSLHLEEGLTDVVGIYQALVTIHAMLLIPSQNKTQKPFVYKWS